MNWINVKDKLPELNSEVLIWYKSGDDEGIEIVTYEELYHSKEHCFMFDYNDGEYRYDYNSCVTHWCIPTKPE